MIEWVENKIVHILGDEEVTTSPGVPVVEEQQDAAEGHQTIGGEAQEKAQELYVQHRIN